MTQLSEYRAAGKELGASIATDRVEGIVERVDTIARELAVRLPAGRVFVDVPSDCPVLLYGERIKLRMVQPGDRVRIGLNRSRGLLISQMLEVQPDQSRVALSR